MRDLMIIETCEDSYKPRPHLKRNLYQITIILYEIFCHLDIVKTSEKKGTSWFLGISNLVDWAPIRQILEEMDNTRS